MRVPDSDDDAFALRDAFGEDQLRVHRAGRLLVIEEYVARGARYAESARQRHHDAVRCRLGIEEEDMTIRQRFDHGNECGAILREAAAHVIVDAVEVRHAG